MQHHDNRQRRNRNGPAIRDRRNGGSLATPRQKYESYLAQAGQPVSSRSAGMRSVQRVEIRRDHFEFRQGSVDGSSGYAVVIMRGRTRQRRQPRQV